MTTELWIDTGIISAMLIVSAFFSASETGMTAASRARIYELARKGSRRATMVLSLLSKRERLIGTLLLGNNIMNIWASALATTVMLGLFGASGVIYATIGMTILVLVFGEVMPKTYAIHGHHLRPCHRLHRMAGQPNLPPVWCGYNRCHQRLVSP